MVVTVAGSDVHEELGPTVVHHVDVEMGGSRPSLPVTQVLDDARKRFPTGQGCRPPVDQPRSESLIAAMQGHRLALACSVMRGGEA